MVNRATGRRLLLVVSVILSVLVILWLLIAARRGPGSVRAEVVGYGPAGDPAGFQRAVSPRTFRFPDDHGPHPRFQTEWWYYTGNLEAAGGRRFGYQLTFFRRALAPAVVERPSEFGANQAYMAHFTLTDVAASRFYSTERLARGAAGVAGAEGPNVSPTLPYRVWLDDWSASQTGGGEMRLVAENQGVSIDLSLVESKPPVLQGDAGLSRKSAAEGNASYYYSLTRLQAAGTLRVAGQTHAVQGLSWMDHEFGTSSLGPGAVGWDWFSLQLSDGREVMYFQIRQDDGTIEPLSGGTLVLQDGRSERLALGDVRLEVLDSWRSPRTRALYPARWRMTLEPAGEVLEVVPATPDQELRVTLPYWEGAVRVFKDGAEVGVGYVEMTGYTGAIRGQF